MELERSSCPAGSRRADAPQEAAQLGLSPGGDGGGVWTSWTCSVLSDAGLASSSPPPEHSRRPEGFRARGSDISAPGHLLGCRRVSAGTGVSAHSSHSPPSSTDRPCLRLWGGDGGLGGSGDRAGRRSSARTCF